MNEDVNIRERVDISEAEDRKIWIKTNARGLKTQQAMKTNENVEEK